MLAPAILILTANQERRARLDEAVESCRSELPKLQALVPLVAALPESLRPCLGFGGVAVLATLPEAERDMLKVLVLSWLADHPVEAQVLNL